MKRFLKVLTAITLSLLLVFGSSLGVYAASVPDQDTDNKLKVESLSDGVYTDDKVDDNNHGPLSVTIDFHTVEKEVRIMDWSSNIPVEYVYVKGGNGGNFYHYPDGSYGDIDLVAPLNKNGNTIKNYGISHVTFYYNEGSIIINKQVLGDPEVDETFTFDIVGPDGYTNTKEIVGDGQVVVGGLGYGQYTITEVSIPEGYDVDDEEHIVNLSSKNKSDTVTFANTFTPAPLGTVTAHYWDQENNELADNVVLYGFYEDPYETNDKSIEGYQLKEIIGDETGEFGEEPINVYYIYEPEIIPTGTVIVHYLFGEEKLNDEIELNGAVGSDYTAERKSFLGYYLISIPDNEEGLFTEETIHVYYYYEITEEPQGMVTAHYWDEENNELADDVVLYGFYEDPYETNDKSIEGYQLKEIIGDENGVFGEKPINVYYIYEPITIQQSVVIARYLDEMEGDLTYARYFYGSYGEPYETELLEFEGYVLAIMPSNASGTFGEETIHVYYLYESGVTPVRGSITIVKDIIGNTPPSNATFSFQLVGPLESEGSTTRNFTIIGEGSNTFNNLIPGVYRITESTPPTNYTIESGNNALISIEEVLTATATVTNRYTASTPDPDPDPDPDP
ncbi:MAG: MucBP domain-containing protein, partial [Clostridia bacterium]|nr:MucBP domain-containing protein [Clostridia bacterium]